MEALFNSSLPVIILTENLAKNFYFIEQRQPEFQVFKDTPLICEFAQYSVPLKNKVFSLNSMFNYFHLFETEKWRSEIYKKIIQKYESCL